MADPIEKVKVPERLARLKDLVYNLWWCWHPEARGLFKEIDRNLWRTTYHNPVLLLQESSARLDELARDEVFLARYDSVIRLFDEYMEDQYTWFARKYPQAKDRRIAYFSAEFGVHNSLRIYSGGLGILAADHCKTASDLGVPLTGVGFMYPQGYVQQRISVDGWQQNVYEAIDWNVSPIRPVVTSAGKNFLMPFSLGPLNLQVAVWEIVVGRVHLYLMDTHVEGNSPQDWEITGRLYGGDRTMRLRQEILLGIGGVRLLRTLGLPADHYHVNEGHSAFMFLELVREAVAKGRTFADAARDVAGCSVFTTHTPVEAGHDVFSEGLVAEYFNKYWAELGLDQEQFMELGRVPGQAGWNMTALALKMAGQRNAVSRRHGIVSRKMWAKLWPDKKEEDVPIGHVTNGVHLTTWLQQDLGWNFYKRLGRDWPEKQDDPSVWTQVAGIPDEELWDLHMRNKEMLFKLLRDRARDRWISRNAEASQILTQGALLDPQALTIGFARRFAGYKRATLILRDLARLQGLLLDHWRPIQLVFAGKSHPADDSGKALIQQIYQLSKDPAFGGRIVFVEDYDMHVARYFVQGCDLWLNNPLAPLEACGTSGIKAAVNGVPSLSILDGWWEEGFNGANGWAIGEAGGRGSGDAADAADAEDIYQALEKKIVPLFYDRGPDGIPHGWIRVMKESIKTVAPRFCGNRMVKDYVKMFYGAEAAPQTGGARITAPETVKS